MKAMTITAGARAFITSLSQVTLRLRLKGEVLERRGSQWLTRRLATGKSGGPYPSLEALCVARGWVPQREQQLAAAPASAAGLGGGADRVGVPATHPINSGAATPSTAGCVGTTLIFDIEANGLLDTVTRVHCIAITDAASGRHQLFSGALYDDTGEPAARDGSIEDGLAALSQADILVGHNAIAYDLAVLAKIYGWEPRPGARVIDTLITSQTLFGGIEDDDAKKPQKPHALEAWGHRLHQPKSSYKGSWAAYTQAMGQYCRQDTVTTLALLRHIETRRQALKELGFDCPVALEIEHALGPVLRDMTAHGLAVDAGKLAALGGTVCAKVKAMEVDMQQLRPPRTEVVIPQASNARYGNVKGVPKECLVHFNPRSLDDKRTWLIELGWEPDPEELTASGDPSVKREILRALPYPEAHLLADYDETYRLAAQVKTWHKYARVDADGVTRLHGSVNQCGCRTGRASHHDPNIAQVKRSKECREIFIASPGYVLVGADLDGIEMRGAAHEINDPEFTELVISGSKKEGTDAHSRVMQAVGLLIRDTAKTAFFATLYGSGRKRLGALYARDHNIVKPSKAQLARLGAELRARMTAFVPGIDPLRRKVQAELHARGHLIGIDGRPLRPAREFTAVNTVVQASCAVIAKKWLLLAVERLAGIAQLVGWIHDELLFEARPEDADVVKKILEETAAAAGVFFDFRCPISATAKIGASWDEVH